MDSESKANQVSGPLPETMPDPVLVRMLEIMPLEGEDKEAMASSKEAAPKGGTDNSSPKGKKRAASDDLETMASKRGRKSSSEGPTPGSSLAGLRPQGDQPSSEP